MNADSAAFSGSIPHVYDECLAPIIFENHAIDMARRVAGTRPIRVLETAAGTGIVTRRLRDTLATNAHLTATDLQAGMLDIARAKFRADEDVAFALADATALPFADATFDAIVCQFGVMFYPDKDRSYREALRVLTPGGRYHFSVWDSHRFNAFPRVAHATLGAAFTNDPPQFMTVPFSYAFEPIKDSLIAAGFSDITASVVRISKDVPDVLQFARGVIFGSPMVDQLRARGTVDIDALVATLARNFAAEFGNPARTILQAIVFSAEKP